jgi:NAD(P)H-hydrate repair Nnr-like enzyme with NAD(P)H-hydrate dehydratase domain
MSCIAGGAADQRHRLGCSTLSTSGASRFGSDKARLTIVEQFGEIERFRQIFVGAGFGRPDGGHERVLRAHDDDRQFGPRLLDARQHVEGVFVRHHHVGDDEIALARRYPPPERRCIRRDADFDVRRATAPG